VFVIYYFDAEFCLYGGGGDAWWWGFSVEVDLCGGSWGFLG